MNLNEFSVLMFGVLSLKTNKLALENQLNGAWFQI